MRKSIFTLVLPLFLFVSCEPQSSVDCSVVSVFCGDLVEVELTINGNNYLEENPNALIQVTQQGFTSVGQVDADNNRIILVLYQNSPILFTVDGVNFQLDMGVRTVQVDCCGPVIRLSSLSREGNFLCNGQGDCDEVVQLPLDGLGLYARE
ncbi:hypothetical protein [Aureicoccus marinus]|nr:hypothetical protein [Aureicoccus marinus]